MKYLISYDEFQAICLGLCPHIRRYNPETIVAISRGGLLPAQIISKELRLPVDFYIPDRQILTVPDTAKRVVFIEDIISHGRTFTTLTSYLEEHRPKLQWEFIPIAVDKAYPKESEIKVYGIKTLDWVVFPYEDVNKVVEGDSGLFRDNTDLYGKNHEL